MADKEDPQEAVAGEPDPPVQEQEAAETEEKPEETQDAADAQADGTPGEAATAEDAPEQTEVVENAPDTETAAEVAPEQGTEGENAPEEAGAEDAPEQEVQAEDAPEQVPTAEDAGEDEAEAEAGVEAADNAEDEQEAPVEQELAADVIGQEDAGEQKIAAPTPELPSDNVGTGTEPNTQEPEVDPHAPSPTPKVATEVPEESTATVKFVLMPSGQVATLRCKLRQTLAELKDHFAFELKMPANLIMLLFDGKMMDDSITLGGLGVGPNGTVQLEMQSADPVNTPIRPFRPRQEYHMPDVITVRVQTDEEGDKDVVVEIERATKKKPFLGGYRHKKSGVEFHHASAQTMQKQRPMSSVEKFCRDTQTTQQRHRVQQTTNDMSTQMTKIGVYVSNMQDKLLVPGKYTTAESYRANIMNQVVVIQKYYRRWLAKRYVVKVRSDKEKRLEWERQEEIRKKKEKEDRIRREFERRMNPKSKEDFDLLYHALEKWRQEELDRINMTLTGAERKAALCQLLEQETQLIASIGRHKLEADDENRQKRIQGFLDKAAAAKKWKGPDGKVTEMDTPYTIRAKELQDIYNSINMKYLTQDERLDVLLTLKHTVKEHDCKLTQEVIELIDREADLLMRGVKESNLDGLRKRISTLFLQYIKTPVFNPEAARLLKVPQDPSTLRKNIYFCSSCNQYLPSTEFQLSSNSSAVGKCRKCQKIDNDARVRQDYSHYRYMLKSLRRTEQAYGDGSKIAFLLQETDLRHLVENVWNSQSVLSAWEDLYDLVLVRWDKHQQWAPWNCILLTKEEASAHEKLENLDEAYGHVFIHKVKHKHTLARNYFSRMPDMAEHMRGAASASSAMRGHSVSGKAVPSKA